MKGIDELKRDAEAIKKKAQPYKTCKDGSYQAALHGFGYYKILQQIKEIESSENLQSK